MSRDSQHLGRAAAPLLKLVQRKLGTTGLLGVVVLAALYVAVLQPWIARRFSVTLPTLVAQTESETATPTSRRPAPKPGPHHDTTQQQPEGDTSEGLTKIGRDAYRSAAGLRYTRGSQDGTRLAHLMSHTHDQPDRDGPHGVFDSDDQATVVRLVDEAYTKALAGEHTTREREGDQTVYEIDMGRRIGYVGGASGNRRGKPSASHLRLVVQGDRFITAFPFRP